jgi:porin
MELVDHGYTGRNFPRDDGEPAAQTTSGQIEMILKRILLLFLLMPTSLVVLQSGRPATAQEELPRDHVPPDLAKFQVPSSEPALRRASSWLHNWLAQDYMFDNWGGLRTALLERGITPSIAFAIDVLGNPVGGQRHGLREFANLGLDVDFDLAKLADLTGSRFHVSVSQRWGTNLSKEDIGNVLNVAQLCCGPTFRLVNLYLEQSLQQDQFNIRLGRMVAGDEFLSSPLYALFVQTGINSNPAGILLNVPGMTSYPFATWGLRLRVKPVESLYAMAGVFNGDSSLADNRKHGVDFSMRGPVFAIAEAGYRFNQGKGDTGLPGNHKLGVYYDNGRFADFLRDHRDGISAQSGLPPRTIRGNTGFYILMDQMLYREGDAESKQGLTPLAALLIAPNENVNRFPLFVAAGLVYQGLLPHRDRDVAAFGAVYGKFSDQLQRAQRVKQLTDPSIGIQRYELALEWTYMIQVTPWLQVQPDIQYIINPGGTGRIKDALVVGFQLALNF